MSRRVVSGSVIPEATPPAHISSITWRVSFHWFNYYLIFFRVNEIEGVPNYNEFCCLYMSLYYKLKWWICKWCLICFTVYSASFLFLFFFCVLTLLNCYMRFGRRWTERLNFCRFCLLFSNWSTVLSFMLELRKLVTADLN